MISACIPTVLKLKFPKVNRNQIREDEMYARMLQDQLFVQQIRVMPEFSSMFGPDPRLGAVLPSQNEPDVLDKLKHLGDGNYSSAIHV